MRSKGAVVTCGTAKSIVEAIVKVKMPSLMNHPGGSVVKIDKSLVRSIFRRMKFVKRVGTKSTKSEVKNLEEQVRNSCFISPVQIISRIVLENSLSKYC